MISNFEGFFAYLNLSCHDRKICGSVNSLHYTSFAESLLLVIVESFVLGLHS